MRFSPFDTAARPLMLAMVAAAALLEPACGSRQASPADSSLSPAVAYAPSLALPESVAPAAATPPVESVPAANAQPAAAPELVDAASASLETAAPAELAAPTGTPAPTEEVAAASQAAESAAPPAQPAADITPVAPAEAPAPAAPARPVVPAVQPVGSVQRPFAPQIERWRALVRQELAVAAAEGRLTGGARQLNDDLILAMMQQESGGDPTAESWAGAMGLMQVMPATFSGYIYGDWNLEAPEETILDPTLNVRVGVRYMAESLQALGGDLYWAVSSYNAGVGAVQAWRSVGLTAVPPIGGYAETAAYAPVILSNYATKRPDVPVTIPAPITDDQIPAIVALLTNAGLW